MAVSSELVFRLQNPWEWTRYEVDFSLNKPSIDQMDGKMGMYECPICHTLTTQPDQHLFWHVEELGK